MKTSIITRTAILIAVALIGTTTTFAVPDAQAKPHIKCLRWVGLLSTGRHCTKWIIVP